MKREGFFCEEPSDRLPWFPKSYACSFCQRRFRSAQALGGHMNVHRRERARLKQLSSWIFECHAAPLEPNPNIVVTSSSHCSHSQSQLNPTLLPPSPSSSPSVNKPFSCASSSSLSSDLHHGEGKELAVVAADESPPSDLLRWASDDTGKKRSKTSTGVAGAEKEAKATPVKDKLIEVHGNFGRLELEIGSIEDPSRSLDWSSDLGFCGSGEILVNHSDLRTRQEQENEANQDTRDGYSTRPRARVLDCIMSRTGQLPIPGQQPLILIAKNWNL